MNMLFLFLWAFLPSAPPEDFTRCAAAFLDGKMIVASYDVGAVASLSRGQKGTLTVNAVTLGPGQADAGERTEFMVAIRDAKTGTNWMYTSKWVQQVSVADVLARCAPGDVVMVITNDRQWALPHGEIVVRE